MTSSDAAEDGTRDYLIPKESSSRLLSSNSDQVKNTATPETKTSSLELIFGGGLVGINILFWSRIITCRRGCLSVVEADEPLANTGPETI